MSLIGLATFAVEVTLRNGSKFYGETYASTSIEAEKITRQTLDNYDIDYDTIMLVGISKSNETNPHFKSKGEIVE